MRETLEKNLEKGLFASRWFIAPVYIILAISLGIITLKVIQEFIHVVPEMFSMTVREVMLFVLHVVDLAFFLGGKPEEISTFISGSLDWHPSASAKLDG